MNLATERIKYVIAVIIYGTIGLFLRYVSLPSEFVAMCRGTIGAIFIILYQRSKNQKIDFSSIRKNLKWLILSGIMLGLNWVFLFAAYMETTVAVASLCNYMAPMIVIIIAPAVLREKLEIKKLPCVAAAFVGIILVSGVWHVGIGNISGVFLGLAAAFCFVIIVICNRKISGISAFDKAWFQLALSSVTILPYFLIKNRGISLDWDVKSLLIVLLLGVFHTGFAYCLYFSGMGTLPVQTVAVLGYLEPVVSVLCSVIFLHEYMDIFGWLGAVLIIGAAVISELLTDKKELKR